MDHVALDRAGADDRDFDDEVVKFLRLQPRKHAHLRPAFDLEGAERVGALDHFEHRRVVVLEILEADADALMIVEQVERPAHAAHHAEAEHIDLHEAQFLDIVFFPFDDVAVGHRRRLDRDEVVEPVAGQDEAARVLAQVARGADQLAGEVECQRQPRIAGIEVQFIDMALLDALVRPAPHLAGERTGHILGQAERLADLAHRAARAVAADDGGDRGMLAAVGFVDPLDHFLAPFMLEIDVDVGRFVARVGNEPLEQQFVRDRVDRGDPEHVADHRIGGRSAPLAEDALASGESDDRIHGQEIRRIFEPADQPQLMVEQLGHKRPERRPEIWPRALRGSSARARPGACAPTSRSRRDIGS